MHLLDTDTLTHLHAGHSSVVERLRRCEDPDIGITIFTKAEILRARCDFLLKAADGEQIQRAQARLQHSELLLAELMTVGFDKRASNELSRLRDLRGLGMVGHVDLLIASIALAHRATLVTRNLRHFRQIPVLKLENWVD